MPSESPWWRDEWEGKQERSALAASSGMKIMLFTFRFFHQPFNNGSLLCCSLVPSREEALQVAVIVGDAGRAAGRPLLIHHWAASSARDDLVEDKEKELPGVYEMAWR